MNRALRTHILGIVFQAFCLVANMLAIFFLLTLLIKIFSQGAQGINVNFLSSYPSRFPEKAGVLSAWVGTVYLMVLTAFFSIPMGLGAAIYLEEYAGDTKLIRFIKLNIKNLSGVPSIIYGILGLTLFVRGMHLGRSLLAGALTMSLMILPVITLAAQEALKAVPMSMRWAGYGIGMTRWQVIRYQVLPQATPGITTGVILALSRAIGETAPLIMLGALTYVAFLPQDPLDAFTVLPIQIFNWTARPQKGFHDLAASGIIILLLVLLAMNALAIYIRIQYKSKLKELYS